MDTWLSSPFHPLQRFELLGEEAVEISRFSVIAFSVLALGYVALGLLSWRVRRIHSGGKDQLEAEQRKLREREIAVGAEKKKASEALNRAYHAVSVMTEFVTASMPDVLASERVREQLVELAFKAPELFRQRIDDLSGKLRHFEDSALRAVPFDQTGIAESPPSLIGLKAEKLRKLVRQLRNSGVISRRMISGAEVASLRKEEAIRLIVEFDPRLGQSSQGSNDGST